MAGPLRFAVSSRTKARFVRAAVRTKRYGSLKTSYPRILEESGLTIAQLHALFSPVTELPGGYTVIARDHVDALEAALGSDGRLLAILTTARDTRKYTDEKEEARE